MIFLLNLSFPVLVPWMTAIFDLLDLPLQNYISIEFYKAINLAKQRGKIKTCIWMKLFINLRNQFETSIFSNWYGNYLKTKVMLLK